MAADGCIIIDTRIDQSGFEKDSRNLVGTAKSRAAKLAGEYRKQGLSASDAFKKAWSEIERDTKTGATKSGKYIKEEIGGATSSASSQLSGLSASMSSFIKRVAYAAAAAFSVNAIVNFGKQCVELGSNISEVQNVVDTAFGDMSYKIEQFAETSIQNFGMSRLSAKKTASTYMAMARGMGMAEEQASNMAISLTALTGDVASFYNISQELADVKLKSVFTGETETLKDLGVVMTQANLDAYALANGFGKTTSAMSQTELVALRYAFVTDQLRIASGDFIKTQDSWANQTRILSMQWQELMSVMGQGLIQVLTPVVKAFNQILSTLIEIVSGVYSALSEIFGKANNDISATENIAGSVANTIDQSASNQNDLTDAIKKTNKEQTKSLASFDTLNKLDNGQAINTSLSQGAAASDWIYNIRAQVDTSKAEKQTNDFAKKIKDLFRRANEYIYTNFQPSINAWSNAFRSLQEPAANAAASIHSSFNKLKNETLAPLSNYTINTFVPEISNSFSTNMAPIFTSVMKTALSEFAKDFEYMCKQIHNFVMLIVYPAMELFKKITTGTFEIIANTWKKHGEELLDNITKFRDSLKNIWDSIYKVISPVIDHLWSKLNELWDEHLRPMWESITDFFMKLWNLLLDLWNNVLAPLVQWLVSTFGPFVGGVFNVLIDVVVSLGGAVADVVGGIFKALGGLIDFISGVFSGDWEKAWNGIKDIFSGIWDSLVGIVRGVLNAIISILNFVFEGVFNAVKKQAGVILPIFGYDKEKIESISPPKIPALARGAVIPANREFLAVLGDQKHGRNLEAPEDLIRQIVREETSGSGAKETTIRFEGTMGQLIRAMKPYLDEEDRRRGVRLVNSTI